MQHIGVCVEKVIHFYDFLDFSTLSTYLSTEKALKNRGFLPYRWITFKIFQVIHRRGKSFPHELSTGTCFRAIVKNVLRV